METQGKKKHRGFRHKKARRGASVVELAVVSPLLITMIFGIIEFGYAFMVRQIVANAAREGAREAAIQVGQGDPDDAEIRDVVREALTSIASLELGDDAISIQHWCKDGGGTPDFSETVTVTVPYDDISLLGDFFSWIDFNDIEVSSSMRAEGVTEESDPPDPGVCP